DTSIPVDVEDIKSETGNEPNVCGRNLSPPASNYIWVAGRILQAVRYEPAMRGLVQGLAWKHRPSPCCVGQSTVAQRPRRAGWPLPRGGHRPASSFEPSRSSTAVFDQTRRRPILIGRIGKSPRRTLVYTNHGLTPNLAAFSSAV